MKAFLEKFFRLAEFGTNIQTEVMAGLATFMGMAYILAVNPSILSASGMDAGAIFTATAVAAAVGTLLMALTTNYPFALAPGMGVNAYFAYTVVLQMGYTWQMALAAVFIEGLVFIVLSFANVREKIFDMVPQSLRLAITVGLGLFIALIGLVNSGLVVGNPSTLVAIHHFHGATTTANIKVILAVLGVIFTGVMMHKNVKGAMLWGILGTWIAGICCELGGLYVPNPAEGVFSLIPSLANGISVPSMAPTFMHMDFSQVLSFNFLVVVFAFLFVDVFDTVGTLMGCSIKAGYLNDKGELPKIKPALLADAVATSVGAVLGTSTTTTFVESSIGVSAGGRTGLTGVVVAILFGLSLFLSPVFLAIPGFATAPALILVGYYMMQAVVNIDFDTPTEGIPAFLCIAVMAFSYSIAEGIGAGILSYTVLNLCAGKKEKVSILMIIVAIMFIGKYIFI